VASDYKNNKFIILTIAILILFLGWEIIALLLQNPALPCPIPAIAAFFQVFSAGALEALFWSSTYRGTNKPFPRACPGCFP